mmetsp:Transcript_66864/g.116298  ORF Transcript_66864/g.116298 Transcript_66864/m.116298 type:complete len:759 (+) Transcript_66864:76-2352(+)
MTSLKEKNKIRMRDQSKSTSGSHSRCPSQTTQVPPSLVHLSGANFSQNSLHPIAVSDEESTELSEDLLTGSNSLPLLVHVRHQSECFCGYSMPTHTRNVIFATGEDDESCGIECDDEALSESMRIRLPLLLARVRKLTHAATFGRHMLAISIQPEKALRSGLHFMHKNHARPMPSNVTGTWVFECESEEAREDLFCQLQLAGCLMEGLQERYSILQLLGAGSTSQVFLAEDLKSGEPVAVKMVGQQNCGNSHDGSSLREALLLHWLQHPALLHFHGLYQTVDAQSQKRQLAIVVEFVGGGELFEEVRSQGPMAEAQAHIVMLQLFSVLHFLHQRGIAHRDIKTENVIRVGGDNGAIKLVDFGLAASEMDPASMTARCGSPGYIAPEVLRGERYGCKVDCFSVGVLMYILLVGRCPFRGTTISQLLAKNLRCRISQRHLTHVSAEAKDLLTKLLTAFPSERHSADQALAHPWCSSGGRHMGDELRPPPTPPSEPMRRVFSEQLNFSDIFSGGLRFSDDPPGAFEMFSAFPPPMPSAPPPLLPLPGAIDTADLPGPTNDFGEEAPAVLASPRPNDEEPDKEDLQAEMEMKILTRESFRSTEPIWANMQRTISSLRAKGLMPLDKRDLNMKERHTAFYSWDVKQEASRPKDMERASAVFMRDLGRQENSFCMDHEDSIRHSFNNLRAGTFEYKEIDILSEPLMTSNAAGGKDILSEVEALGFDFHRAMAYHNSAYRSPSPTPLGHTVGLRRALAASAEDAS